MTSVPEDSPREPSQPPQERPPQGQPEGQAQRQAQPEGHQPQYQQPQPPQPPQYGAQQYPQPQYPQQYPAGQYAAAPYAPYAVTRPTNVLGIIALVLSLIGVSIGAVICGHISLKQLKTSGEQGYGLALAGLIVGYVGCAGWILFWIAWLSAFIVPFLMLGSIATTGEFSNS